MKDTEKLAKKEEREEFFSFFHQLQSLYEILSPDAFLRPYIRDYQSLARLYALIRNAYNSVQVDEELKNKTKEILQKNAEGGPIDLPGAIHELGPEELAKLKQSGLSDRTKILNLNKALNALVERDGKSKPFLKSIGERAQSLAQTYEERQVSTQLALAEFESLAQECVLAEEERRELGLDENCFAIYKALQPHIEGATKEQAEELNGLVGAHPDYLWNDQEERELRAKLYKHVLPLAGPEKMTELTDRLLELQRV